MYRRDMAKTNGGKEKELPTKTSFNEQYIIKDFKSQESYDKH
jgi:hypothetical protein